MVFVSSDQYDRHCFELRPNRSMSWNATVVFYLGVVAFSLTIAVAFLLLGFWPILPFAGVELLGLGSALYLCAKSGEAREVVRVSETSVTIEKGVKHVERSWQFNRGWTRVTLVAPRVAWYPSRLLVGSHGTVVEVGQFLNEQQRRQLAGELRDVIKLSRDPEVIACSGTNYEHGWPA